MVTKVDQYRGLDRYALDVMLHNLGTSLVYLRLFCVHLHSYRPQDCLYGVYGLVHVLAGACDHHDAIHVDEELHMGDTFLQFPH